MKYNVFVLKYFASRLCSEQQGREWNEKLAVMILINVGIANRLYRRGFSRLKSDLIVLFKPAACCVWHIERALLQSQRGVRLQQSLINTRQQTLIESF